MTEPTPDRTALAEKYRLERAKRLRADGNAQYIDTNQAFTHYVEDPYVDPGSTRPPIEEEIDALVVGGGFSGMLAGVQLRKAGIRDFRIVEGAGDFGGTWYWNRYPGAACDTEAYIYMPLLEETGYIPSQRYAGRDEIFAHCQRIAATFDLYSTAIFQTTVKAARWIPERRRWLVETSRQDKLYARYVILAGGLLHKPKLPDLPGLGSFKGHTFHTSRWDYAYTGGDSDGALTGLADKRVGIIGTGATAVQAVPHLGAGAKHLTVFQRTPTSVDIRNNSTTDPAWAGALHAGWQQERMENFSAVVSGEAPARDIVNDGWTAHFRSLFEIPPEGRTDPSKIATLMAEADYRKMDELRARIATTIKDPATAEALKPWYARNCKRPCFHDDYLETFNRPNVTLVDTDGRGVDAITETGVVVGGAEYPLDCLIFATGFEFAQDYTRRLGFDPEGQGGLRLSTKMAGAYATLHGMTSRGFPNLLIIATAQASGSVNFPHMLGVQAGHAAYIVAQALARGVTQVQPTEAAEDGWVNTILGYENGMARMFAACTPSYLNSEGHLADTPAAARRAGYGGGVSNFIKLLAAWREEGALAGLELS
jgi:cyclohexanone monooxygenase